jgi:hypothetical protein
MPDSNDVEAWLQVHRELMEREAAFTDLALQAATGALAVAELEGERRKLMDLRTFCVSMYAKAFPKRASQS